MSKGRKTVTGIFLFLVIASCIAWLSVRDRPQNKEYLNKDLSENNNESGLNNIIDPNGTNVQTRFKTPDGYTRFEEDDTSFAEFVRNYPLYPDKSLVYLYNKEPKARQDVHAAVFKMDLSDRDLQQCADSVMRMYAEYYWNTHQYDKIGFHFVSGFFCSYDKWREGCRVSVNGNDVQWVKSEDIDTSREGFEQYLETVFTYAGTLSMEDESAPADISDIKIGDVFLWGGSPGHVVMVADVCINEQNNDKAFLLAQGYMPAQQFHILKNPAHEDDPWYYLSEFSWPFKTPEYTFKEGTLKRPMY